MSDKFNLQVPVTKEVELKLRYKAESLGMNLTQYVRFIIMQDVLNIVVPEDFKPRESKRKPPNAKGRNKGEATTNQDSSKVQKQEESTTVDDQPTKSFKINKSDTDNNPFGGK